MTLVYKLPLENFEETALPERLAMVEDSHTMRGLPFRGIAAAVELHCGAVKGQVADGDACSNRGSRATPSP